MGDVCLGNKSFSLFFFYLISGSPCIVSYSFFSNAPISLISIVNDPLSVLFLVGHWYLSYLIWILHINRNTWVFLHLINGSLLYFFSDFCCCFEFMVTVFQYVHMFVFLLLMSFGFLRSVTCFYFWQREHHSFSLGLFAFLCHWYVPCACLECLGDQPFCTLYWYFATHEQFSLYHTQLITVFSSHLKCLHLSLLNSPVMVCIMSEWLCMYTFLSY